MSISVVIPSFNEEKYIGNCLASLQKQTVKADEIIVVDNNSSDRTAEIAKSYGAKVITEKRQGMIFARNAGFDAAKGDIIIRSDADSSAPADWIEKVKIHFDTQKIDAVTGPVVYDFAHQNTLYCNFYSYLLRFLLGYTILIGPNMGITKKMWQQVKDTVCLDDKKVHEDIDLSIHIHKLKGIAIYDPSLITQTSNRRIKHNPLSFFIEYPMRLIKTFLSTHK